MATLSRQPFAPLDGTRLHTLTSLKNRQNATSSPKGKRKAESFDLDDSENVDPILFAKRSKGDSAKESIKPSYILKTPSTRSILSPKKPTAAARRPQTLLKSPTAKLSASISKSPLSAPAGRSPPRGKRTGLLSNRRRTAGPYTRVDPPAFNLGVAAAPFSLDAALKGTISGYGAPRPSIKETFALLHEPDAKASWTFEIHEDTPEQEMTNLLQHSTCVLDISSDDESKRKANREEAEGRDKENVPPVDDVSQTARRAARTNPDDMVVEKERVALGEMNAADYYAEGCDELSVILIHDDDEPAEPIPHKNVKPVLEPLPEVEEDVESRPTSKAAVLEPIEGTGESFELWESDSTQDETEAGVATPGS